MDAADAGVVGVAGDVVVGVAGVGGWIDLDVWRGGMRVVLVVRVDDGG